MKFYTLVQYIPEDHIWIHCIEDPLGAAHHINTFKQFFYFNENYRILHLEHVGGSDTYWRGLSSFPWTCQNCGYTFHCHEDGICPNREEDPEAAAERIGTRLHGVHVRRTASPRFYAYWTIELEGRTLFEFNTIVEDQHPDEWTSFMRYISTLMPHGFVQVIHHIEIL